MLRKYALFVGVAALGALVTSCGGGGGNPAPTPTPTGTPTPTPTPTVTNFDLTQAFQTDSNNANLTSAWFTPTAGGSETFNGAARVNGLANIRLVISPDSVTFGFPDLTNPVAFAATELVSATAARREYARANEGIVLERPFTHVLRVTYQQSQPFTRDTVAGTLRGHRSSLFFNLVTASTAIDTDINYAGSTRVAGGDPGVTLSNAVSSPDVTLQVRATDDRVRGTIQIFQIVNSVSTLAATLTIDSPLNANGTFQGSFTDTTNKFAGSFAGSLAGPGREEMFLIFSITGNENATDDRRFVGTFIGNRLP